MSRPLATPRLSLTPVVADDWRDYHSILADPLISRRSDLPRQPTQRRTQALVDWMVRVGSAGKGFAWMIRDKDAGQLIGCIRINRIDRQQSVGIVGYEVAPALWGRGYGTEALLTVVQHGHHAMDIYRLEAWTLEGNPQSDRVLLKAGFRHEGTQRAKMLLDKERLDMRLFGRLSGDPIMFGSSSSGQA